MAKRRSTKVSDQIRQLINDCGQTRYEISKATGIDQSVLSKFQRRPVGRRPVGLSMKSLDALGEHLGLVVTMPKAPARRKDG